MSEVSRPEAINNAAHDLAVQRRLQQNNENVTVTNSVPLSENAAAELNRENPEMYNDGAHPAITHTGVGDNRDETGDPEKAALMGAIGGAAVGAAAGSLLGPVGTVVGAIGGALTAGGIAGAAVDVVDQNDNDNTVSGLDDGTIRIPETDASRRVDTPRPVARNDKDDIAPIV